MFSQQRLFISTKRKPLKAENIAIYFTFSILISVFHNNEISSSVKYSRYVSSSFIYSASSAKFFSIRFCLYAIFKTAMKFLKYDEAVFFASFLSIFEFLVLLAFKR